MEEGGGTRPLESKGLKDLEKLINKSFRVRDNRTPIYVELAGNLDRVALDQHQVIFGRRGSGKSCLLIFFRHERARSDNVHTIYILGDVLKPLDFPDVLIRLLLVIFEKLPKKPWRKRLALRMRRRTSAVDEVIAELRALLEQPSMSKVALTTGESNEATSSAGATLGDGVAKVDAKAGNTKLQSTQQIREWNDEKIVRVENRLLDYKEIIQAELDESDHPWGAFIIDDFYLINPEYQPSVIDYLHRLLRDTDLYLKVGTVKHRTRLLATTPLHVGVQVDQDVDGFNLDQTLEDIDQTGAYLENMLRKLGEEVNVDDAPATMSDDARKDLVLLSGGVPRDYLNIYRRGMEAARRRRNAARITPTDLRRGAAALSNDTKLKDLRGDSAGDTVALETLFYDVVKFCLVDKKKTAFLISKDDIAAESETHELIQQLMDFKLIHLVDESTSAASGRPGRYEAYTLDFALFMEPRRRNIEIVKFWETDNQRRRVRVREAPVYELTRGKVAVDGGEVVAEEALELIETLDVETNKDELQLF